MGCLFWLFTITMKHLRQLIKGIIQDNYARGNGAAVYPQSGGKFPYEVEGGFVPTPEEIEPIKNYVKDFQAFSDNDEVFEFPEEDFYLGLRIERDKMPTDKILVVAEKVINQLKLDPQFYSKLK